MHVTDRQLAGSYVAKLNAAPAAVAVHKRLLTPPEQSQDCCDCCQPEQIWSVTGLFAPSSVRTLDVSPPGRIQRFLLIQLKRKHHSLAVLTAHVAVETMPTGPQMLLLLWKSC